MAEKLAQGRSVRDFFDFQSKLQTWDRYEFKDFSSVWDLPSQTAFRRSVDLYADAMGKDVPGAKAPFTEFYYDTYAQWLQGGEVYFLHMIRNPFDVAASWIKSHIHKSVHNYKDAASVSARNWYRSASMGLARAVRDPAHYRVLKYEDLVADPLSVATNLCLFLGLDFEQDRMLNRVDFPYYQSNSSFASQEAQGSQDTAIFKTSSRKQHLGSQEIAKVSAICGELARCLGYDDEDFRTRPHERPKELKPIAKVSRHYKRTSKRVKKLLGSKT